MTIATKKEQMQKISKEQKMLQNVNKFSDVENLFETISAAMAMMADTVHLKEEGYKAVAGRCKQLVH